MACTHFHGLACVRANVLSVYAVNAASMCRRMPSIRCSIPKLEKRIPFSILFSSCVHQTSLYVSSSHNILNILSFHLPATAFPHIPIQHTYDTSIFVLVHTGYNRTCTDTYHECVWGVRVYTSIHQSHPLILFVRRHTLPIHSQHTPKCFRTLQHAHTYSLTTPYPYNIVSVSLSE